MEIRPLETDKIICVKVGKVARENLYEMTRKYWVVNLDRAKKATHVLAIIDGVVEAVTCSAATRAQGAPYIPESGRENGKTLKRQFQRAMDLGASIVQALKNALGIGSPGHMFYMMEGELERIKNVPSTMEYGITKNVSKLGSKITEVFSPTLSLDKIKTSNADSISRNNSNEPNQTINFYFENTVVDDDERMQKIVGYTKLAIISCTYSST